MSNVYLCVKRKHMYECKKFDTYQEADRYYYNNNTYNSDSSALISVGKFVPKYFHNDILHYKLSDLLIKNKII